MQVDAKLNTISSCNYDGSARRVVLYSTDVLRHPFSITTFEDWVYWTDWDKAAVYRANKFNGKDVEAITSTHTVSYIFFNLSTIIFLLSNKFYTFDVCTSSIN